MTFIDEITSTWPAPQPLVSKNLYKDIVPDQDAEVIAKLDLERYGAIIAGGAALSWYHEEPVGEKDIDVWFKKEKDFEKLKYKLEYDKDFSLHYTSDDALTFTYKENTRIQLIKNRYWKDPQDVLDGFDISVCQIATDGYRWWFSEYFAQDLKNRRLRVLKLHPSIAKRLIKYWVYGFQPSDQDIQKVIDYSDTSWTFKSSDEDYSNAF